MIIILLSHNISQGYIFVKINYYFHGNWWTGIQVVPVLAIFEKNLSLKASEYICDIDNINIIDIY